MSDSNVVLNQFLADRERLRAACQLALDEGVWRDEETPSVIAEAMAKSDAAVPVLTQSEPTEGTVDRLRDIQQYAINLSDGARSTIGQAADMLALRAAPLQDHGWQDITTIPALPVQVEFFYGLARGRHFDGVDWTEISLVVETYRDERRSLGYWDG